MGRETASDIERDARYRRFDRKIRDLRMLSEVINRACWPKSPDAPQAAGGPAGSPLISCKNPNHAVTARDACEKSPDLARRRYWRKVAHLQRQPMQ